MCYGFRISSLIHLATLTISIQNQKCLKNAKNACEDTHVPWRMENGRPCEPQWIQILWLKMFIMWLDLDAKFVYINSLFKRPDDESFCFIPVSLMTRTVLHKGWVAIAMTWQMHDQMTIVVKCWPLSRFLLHLQLALYFSSYFHSLSSYTMFSKQMLAQINLKQEWLYWCNPGLWIKATFISAIAKNLS